MEQYSRNFEELTPRQDNHKYYREHILQYSLLLLTFIFSIAILVQLQALFWKIIVISALALFYFIFGVWHHLEERNLTSNHLLEYLLVAAIIFVVLFSTFLS